MIKLKILESGHTLTIPGLKQFRTPAEIDISKLDVRKVLIRLKAAGIEKYEITSSIEEEETIPKTRVKRVQKKGDRIDKIERMLEKLLSIRESKVSSEKEQINKQLDRIETLFSNKWEVKEKDKKVEAEIEELESFIPEVDISDMKFKTGSVKTVKQDDNSLEDAADILSGLIKK